jgi:putative oxidoreductase
MSQTHLTETGAFLLRVALGIMFLAHSLLLKLFVFTLPGTARFFDSIGLPGWLAYVICAAEAVAGVLLVLGVQTRWVALATVPILAGAVWAHSGNGWMFANANGGWEYPAYLTLLAFVQALLGDGRFALSPSIAPDRIAQTAKGVIRS